MPIPEPIRELRPHATWDLVREGIKMMLPFLAGLGIQQWIREYRTPLMWTAAILVAVAIAYWDRLPRKSGNRDAKSLYQTPNLEITGLWNNAKVVGAQVIYGTAPRDIPATTIEVRVYAGDQWHSQGTATQFGDKWERLCWFGNADCPPGTRFDIVAMVPKTPLPSRIATLPADALNSEIISVIRSTPLVRN
jgi:hypothetical protein